MSDIEFKPIQLEHRLELQSYILDGSSQICDLAFSNLYGWSKRYHTAWAVIEGSLVICFKPQHHQHPAYLMPVCRSGEQLQRVIYSLYQLSLDKGYPLILMGVSPRCREAIEIYCPDCFEFLHDEATEDYVYLREKLSTLSGKSLQSKRNHINKFERLYPAWSYEEISEDNIDDCLCLARLWLSAEDNRDSSRIDELEMIERCLRHRVELGLQTGALRVDGTIVAFSFGSPINRDTFGVHVEKANTAYEGAYAMMNREFARRIPQQYTYVNREEDLGLEGLRRSKQSYKPELMLIKDTAILRGKLD